ncbi:MAG TPA: hypothetical protein VFY22_13225 [Hydrogenophaga sp.]|nr:hypothetical protein [Hydrogenophaga sp.]
MTCDESGCRTRSGWLARAAEMRLGKHAMLLAMTHTYKSQADGSPGFSSVLRATVVWAHPLTVASDVIDITKW